jgi:aminoglycoside 6-adenylyltransferase
MYRWLAKEEWESYLASYFTGNVSDAWDAVMSMCDLFEQIAKYIEEKLDFLYNELEGKNAREYLEHVRQLPKSAEAVY